jgi:hypothetical protein
MRDLDLLGDVGLFDTGGIQGQHLHVDPAGVHLNDAALAYVLKLFDDFHAARPRIAQSFRKTSAGPGKPSRTGEMLFEGNRSQLGSRPRRFACDLAIALRKCHRRHRCRSRRAGGRGVDEVASIHGNPPRFTAQRHATGQLRLVSALRYCVRVDNTDPSTPRSCVRARLMKKFSAATGVEGQSSENS